MTDSASTAVLPTSTWSQESKETLSLALPLVAAFLGYQTISLTDTIVSARLGVNALAAVSLGSALYWATTIFPLGVLIGLDPQVSQAIGAGHPKRAWEACRRGVGLALVFSLFTAPLVWLLSEQGWPWSSTQSPVTDGLSAYTLGRVWSVPLLLIHTCLRCFLQAHGRVKSILLGTALANLINIPLSAYLGGGDALFNTFGLPSLGVLPEGLGVFGIGLASSLVSLVEVAFLTFKASQVGGRWLTPSSAGWRALWMIGLPIGGSLLSEGGVFSASTLIVSAWSAVEISAHQVTLQLASYTFTICLGISSATSVRVGLAVGAGAWRQARRAGCIGLLLSFGVMATSASSFVLFGSTLASWISPDEEVIELAAQVLAIAAAFQLFDGAQVTAAGALRGAGFTREPFWSALISHWGIGLPAALLFAFEWGGKLYGLWWGLCSGLVCASIILTSRFLILTHREIARDERL